MIFHENKKFIIQLKIYPLILISQILYFITDVSKYLFDL